MRSDTPIHKRLAFGIVQNADGDTARSQEFLIAAKAAILSNHESRNPELHNRARAHHARAQCRIENRIAIIALTSGIANAVHLAMRNRIALLNALIVPSAQNFRAAHQKSAHRHASGIEAQPALFPGERHEFFAGHRNGPVNLCMRSTAIIFGNFQCRSLWQYSNSTVEVRLLLQIFLALDLALGITRFESIKRR
jgi:hypothetical protein